MRVTTCVATGSLLVLLGVGASPALAEGPQCDTYSTSCDNGGGGTSGGPGGATVGGSRTTTISGTAGTRARVSAPTSSPGRTLPYTGAQVTLYALVAVGAIGTGATLLVAGRRRSTVADAA
jgi:LPXTG-motif cell wall-anchored protein